MKTSEDVRISLRSLRRRPVESLLLVIGIALGIGATAAGISMISNSVEERNRALDSPQYREIVAQVREESEDMELAATPTADGENIILSWEDLAAKLDVAEVEYAYLADPAEFRIANFNVGGPTGGAAEAARQSFETSDEGSASSAGPAQRLDSSLLPVSDGPQPVMDEIAGVRVSPEYFDAWNLTTADGSVFTKEEMLDGSKVIVIGSALGETLFEDGQALGRELTIFQSLYRIVGVLEPTGTSIDETGIIPAQAADVGAIQVFARGKFGGGASLHFSVYDSTRLDEAKAQLSLWFEQQYGEGRVVVSIPREEVEAATDRTSRLVTVILFLAVAGLLIASVNVSNILLGRAMRRRRNVGILKALGATVRNVFTLFFLEAFIIGAAGAVLGAGVSMLISSLMASSIAGGAIVSATLFAGIFAAWAITAALTLFPALQASRIPAADALRYE
jgi:putative ABC transport system permease protein